MSEFKLLQFVNCLDDALGYIEEAIYRAECIAEECDGEWEAINNTIQKMQSLKTCWENILDPNVRLAIQEEQEEFDRQSDFTDLQNW